MLWFLTCGVAAAACAAQSRPLQVEAVLAAFTVSSLSVSLAVHAVQTPGVPQAVSRPPVAVATRNSCRRITFINQGCCRKFCLFWLSMFWGISDF